MKKTFFTFSTILLFGILFSCNNNIKHSNAPINTEPIENIMAISSLGGGIIIRRKYKWKVTSDPLNCKSGRGLCISGPLQPDTDQFDHGYLGYNGTALTMYFDEELLEDNESIVNNFLILDEPVKINQEFVEVMKLKKKTMSIGKYKIKSSKTKYDLQVDIMLE